MADKENIEIILYSNNCPLCNALSKKLQEKNIKFIEENDVNKMIQMGFSHMPMLAVNDKVLDYPSALNWLKTM